MSIPDNYDQWEANERRLKQLEDKLPKCDRCHKAIRGEHYFNIYGEIYCEECAVILFRMDVEV